MLLRFPVHDDMVQETGFGRDSRLLAGEEYPVDTHANEPGRAEMDKSSPAVRLWHPIQREGPSEREEASEMEQVS